jgi:S1-C subfamily serine protease
LRECVWQPLQETVRSWYADSAPRWSAAIAFYTIFSLAPVLIIMIAVAGSLWGDLAVRAEVVGQFGELLGDAGARQVEHLIQAALPRGGGRPATASLATRPVIHGMRAKLRLAAVAVLVLGAGRVMAPRTPVPPAPEEKAAPILEEAVERRAPERLFKPLQDAGGTALPYTVSFWTRARFETHSDFESRAEERTPAAFGVLVSDDRVLTHAAVLDGRRDTRVTLADGTEVPARLHAYEPQTGLVLLRLAGGAGAPAAPVASTPPIAGALAVAVARVEGTDFVTPVFVGAVRSGTYTVRPVGGPLRPGMPIYDLRAEAIGITGAEGSIAHSVRGALDRLDALAGQAPLLPRTIGVCFQAITPSIAELVGEGGVLVSDVQEDGPAGRAGVRPGDVLIRVGEVPTPTLDAARRQIASSSSGHAIRATVRRKGRERTWEIPVEETLAQGSCDGPLPAAAPRARTVLTASERSRAGIAPDVFVLAVDGVPAGQRSAQVPPRRREGARLLHLQDGRRRYFAVAGGEE